MTRSYIRVAYRNLVRNKVHSTINLLGIAAGLASVILIGLYIRFETSYDKFFNDSERIYRIALHRIYPGRTKDFGTSSVTIAPILKTNYSSVEEATRLHRLYFQNEILVRIDESDKSFVETKFLYADSLFFKVFSYEFVYGNPAVALAGRSNVVLTESTAKRYFGTANALGKTFTANDSTLMVSGVIKDIPANSHIHFDILASTRSLGFLEFAEAQNNWSSPWVYTYIKLKEGADPKDLEAQFDAMVEKYGGASLSNELGSNWLAEGHKFEYHLQPITDIHLQSHTDVEVEPNSSISYVYVMATIAIIILLISAINFINLSIARSAERAKEVGIRKVLGSHQKILIAQFLFESVFLCLIASIISVAFLFGFIPRFNLLLGTQLEFVSIADPFIMMMIVLFIFLVGILSGLYPALAIASLQPSRVLKGSFKTSKRGTWMRDSMIAFQFLISIVMIAGSLVASEQMSYLQNKNLGFNKNKLLVIKQPYRLGQNYQAFVNEIKSIPGVEKVAGVNTVPGEFHGSNVYKVSDPTIPDLRVNLSFVSDDYLDALEIEVVAGRGFSADFNDSLTMIINESAAKAMALTPEKALGLKFRSLIGTQSEFTIVGVVKDFNYLSLHTEVSPMAILNNIEDVPQGNTVVRFHSNSIQEFIKSLESKWSALSPSPFSFSFLDQTLEQQYKADQNTATIFNIFTSVAIIMSCVGLFGLATYVQNQRSKEMSIRKISGASVMQIIIVFSKSFVGLIAIAFVAGVPMAYYVLQRWLQTFAYHIDPKFIYFLTAGAITLALVLITLAYQAIKIGRINPVQMLRSE